MSKYVDVIYAAIIVSMTVTFFWTGTAGAIVQGTVVALLLPIYIQLMLRRMRPGVLLQLLYVPVGYTMIALISTLINIENYVEDGVVMAVVVSLNVAFMLFTASLIASDSDPHLPERVLRWCGVLMLGFLLYALATLEHATDGDRFTTEHTHPNWWGMLCFGVTCCSLFYRRKRALFVISNVVSVFMMYLAQSRGAMAGVAVALLLYGLIAGAQSAARRPGLVIGTTLGGIGVLSLGLIGFNWSKVESIVLDFLYEDVLFLHDENRGLESGLTGRVDAWIDAWEIWLENPLLGTGFGTNSDVHNGFLIIGSEGGLVYFLFVLALLAAGIKRAGQRQPALLATLVGYMVLIMTYPRSINLNFGAIVFEVALLAAISRKGVSPGFRSEASGALTRSGEPSAVP
ncbi:O-antigen ligase family protein [Azospirillum sp.]|uniref:O-antigen ligase family protein n=1 Tax=Azospirillum sp. TaxID=34012 RepID=UPI003D74C823